MESKIYTHGQIETQRLRDRNKKTGRINRDGDRKIKRGRGRKSMETKTE